MFLSIKCLIKSMGIRKLLREIGEPYSAQLGIDLGNDKGVFKWFLMSILFGARISEGIAIKTYKELEKAKVLAPGKILGTGWDGLVKILDKGGYVRYDYKTADKLLEMAGNLENRYKGSLALLHEQAKGQDELEEELKKLAKGIGPVTVNIFLREMKGEWRVETLPDKYMILAARNLGFTGEKRPEKVLEDLKRHKGLEIGLLRLGKNYCHKGKCGECRFRKYCVKNKGVLGTRKA